MNLPEKAHVDPSTIFFLTTQPPHHKRPHQPASLFEGLRSSGPELRRGSFGDAALSHQKGKKRGNKQKNSSETAVRVVSAEEPDPCSRGVEEQCGSCKSLRHSANFEVINRTPCTRFYRL